MKVKGVRQRIRPKMAMTERLLVPSGSLVNSGEALKFEDGAHVAVGDFSDYEDKVSIVALIKTPAAPRVV